VRADDDNDDDDDNNDDYDDHIAESDDDAVDEYVAGLDGGGRDSGPSRPDRDSASDREDDVPIIPPASPIPGREDDDNDDNDNDDDIVAQTTTPPLLPASARAGGTPRPPTPPTPPPPLVVAIVAPARCLCMNVPPAPTMPPPLPPALLVINLTAAEIYEAVAGHCEFAKHSLPIARLPKGRRFFKIIVKLGDGRKA